jgi:hypothetical protein
LRPNGWPVLPQVDLGVVDGHPIDTRTTLIPTNAPPRNFEIGSIAHFLHQIFCSCRALVAGVAIDGSVSLVSASRASPRSSNAKVACRDRLRVFDRCPSMRYQAYLPLPIVQAFSHRCGSAYPLLRLSASECLTSFTGGMTYYAVC